MLLTQTLAQCVKSATSEVSSVTISRLAALQSPERYSDGTMERTTYRARVVDSGLATRLSSTGALVIEGVAPSC